MLTCPTFGSLFSGIGGLDLGLERAGWTCRWQVENDPFCQRVLARHWPDVRRYDDVTALPLAGLERVELIAGGFPCQPVSVAGKQRGADDERWLWPAFAGVIRALRPRLVLVENVPGLLGRGLGDVVGDLAACGYDAEWDCIPASAVGAPHRRDRVWIVGYRRECGPLERVSHAERDDLREQRQRIEASERADGGEAESRRDGAHESLADPDSGRCVGLPESPGVARASGRELDRCGALREQHDPALADADGPRLEIGGDAAGLRQCAAAVGGRQWAVEPDVGRVAHGIPARMDRLRTLGNAVVPQVAEWIGRRLLAALTGQL